MVTAELIFHPLRILQKQKFVKWQENLGCRRHCEIWLLQQTVWQDDGRTDEDQISATYEELEWCMAFDGDLDDLTEATRVMEIYNRFHAQNKHEMIPIPVYTKEREQCFAQ